MHPYRTHTCGELRQSHIGETVRLSGWVHRVRDHGGILFIDLRDHYGVTQVVADPGSPAFAAAERLRAEWVVRIDGEVRMRPEGTVNPDLATGDVEMVAGTIEVLSEAKELPLPVFGEQEYPEDVRLRYRFLDLRRERMHRNIKKRVEIVDWIRRRMTADGFLEFQTPILTASSPEGARDYLVPSRRYPGKFYALPQAPQQFKQLVMVAGFDRYFQIAPCFRDEDARADRSPGEFYQLDIEMSFVTQDDVFAAVEPVLRGVFEAFGDGASVTKEFPRIAYADAMLKYGTDKPDRRNPILIADVTEEFEAEGVTFNAFRNLIAQGAVVRAIPAPGAAAQPRSFFDKLNDWARKDMQAPGLGYITFEQTADVAPATDDMLQEKASWLRAFQHVIGKGPIAKFVPREVQLEMAWKARLRPGDALFFACDKGAGAAALAGAARIRIGDELGVSDKSRFDFCWIVDFPMFEWNDEDKRIDFSHNPFSMPQGGLEALETRDPLDILAYQYDIVCNGIELSSGAIRNHKPEIMKKAFEIAGYGEDVLMEKFGGLYRAFQYGAPPHGGIAPGLDRIVMMLCGEQNLREVVLFPMNQQAEDPLLGAPSEASPKQLRELHLHPALPQKASGGA